MAFHRRSAAQRREQRNRAEARRLQTVISVLCKVGGHRGCQLAQVGRVILPALRAEASARHREHVQLGFDVASPVQGSAAGMSDVARGGAEVAPYFDELGLASVSRAVLTGEWRPLPPDYMQRLYSSFNPKSKLIYRTIIEQYDTQIHPVLQEAVLDLPVNIVEAFSFNDAVEMFRSTAAKAFKDFPSALDKDGSLGVAAFCRALVEREAFLLATQFHSRVRRFRDARIEHPRQ
eukprot:TRINITY_DN6331_c1_g1_i1.p1 TRINITY_DN6331_c1_g1~~TRINITY_DN6331_c1_g1_i1.p1  ORF type:complete len:234 (-),score=25.85 TRINITY_DN6331_c1_g1_i1:315-1016(-)